MSERRTTPLTPEIAEPHLCSVHTRLDVLRKVPFFASLDPNALRQVNTLFREVGYDSGAPIYFAGDPAARLYVVASGKVKISRHTLSGQDVVLDILASGDFFGSLAILGDATYPDTAQAQTGVCVLGIDAHDFQQILLRYPEVAVAVLQVTAQRLQDAHETIRQLSAFPVERRIAAVLLKLAEKLGEASAEGLLIQVPLARQELADMAGTTVESASRVMSQFQKQGLIRSGRQWVAIADLAGLTAAAREQ
jgi:CRP-like cAMP-binding protein